MERGIMGCMSHCYLILIFCKFEYYCFFSSECCYKKMFVRSDVHRLYPQPRREVTGIAQCCSQIVFFSFYFYSLSFSIALMEISAIDIYDVKYPKMCLLLNSNVSCFIFSSTKGVQGCCHHSFIHYIYSNWTFQGIYPLPQINVHVLNKDLHFHMNVYLALWWSPGKPLIATKSVVSDTITSLSKQRA